MSKCPDSQKPRCVNPRAGRLEAGGSSGRCGRPGNTASAEPRHQADLDRLFKDYKITTPSRRDPQFTRAFRLTTFGMMASYLLGGYVYQAHLRQKREEELQGPPAAEGGEGAVKVDNVHHIVTPEYIVKDTISTKAADDLNEWSPQGNDVTNTGIQSGGGLGNEEDDREIHVGNPPREEAPRFHTVDNVIWREFSGKSKHVVAFVGRPAATLNDCFEPVVVDENMEDDTNKHTSTSLDMDLDHNLIKKYAKAKETRNGVPNVARSHRSSWD